MTKIGALEAGGTKMVLAVYDGDGQELERLTIPTMPPKERASSTSSPRS